MEGETELGGERKYAAFKGRMLIVGFGAVGQGTLPLLLRHIEIDPKQITIVTADETGRQVAQALGVKFIVEPITRDRYVAQYDRYLGPGDFLVMAAFDVSSLDTMEYCRTRNILYIDACLEPWPGGHTDLSVHPARRSNYAYREQALEMRRRHPDGPACVLMHGANPGLVSHLVKEALLQLARDLDPQVAEPRTREEWARLAQRLDIKVIHIAERDSQVSERRKARDEFVNTWSSEAFAGESLQPAELGWGTHEKGLPQDGREFGFGCGSAIYLDRPGAATYVRTWTPLAGTFRGFLISHGEATSIPDYLSVHDSGNGIASYRPTCHYSYHPCDDAVLSMVEFVGNNYRFPANHRLLREEISGGMDELGVLLMGHQRGAYWYGSRLTYEEAHRLCPYNNATSLQVNAPYMAAIAWAINHPRAGIVEPDELPYRTILDIAKPYLGKLVGVYTDWTPLRDRLALYAEDLDKSDPWQFKNFRMT
jgi:homospermidine synthase